MRKLGLILAAAVFGCGMAAAQAPANAPAGSTGICKDGTYSNAPSKSGACSGHKGVQTWYAASAAPAAKPAPTPATKPAPAMPAPTPAASVPSKPAPTPAASVPSKAGPAQAAAAKTAQPGGGPGLVWVNSSSNVYHCYGDTYYGKTKAGAYMSEADAKAKGAHGDHGKTCSK